MILAFLTGLSVGIGAMAIVLVTVNIASNVRTVGEGI